MIDFYLYVIDNDGNNLKREYNLLKPDNLNLIINYETFDPNKSSLEEFYKSLILKTNDIKNKRNKTYISFIESKDNLNKEVLTYISNESIYGDFDILYSDQNLDNNEPYYKPDFSLELLYCQNYMAKMTVYKLSYLVNNSVLSGTLNQNVDWVLSLEAASLCVDPKKIRHVPRVFIDSPDSIGIIDGANTDLFYRLKTIHSLRGRHLNRIKLVKNLYTNKINSSFILPIFSSLNNDSVAILIPIKDKVNLLKNCINSILDKTTYSNYTIYVINNNSVEEETFNYLNDIKNNDKVKVIDYPKEFNYPKLHNDIIADIEEKYVCLLNNDTIVIEPEWLTQAVCLAEDPKVGIVGAKLRYPDNELQHCGVVTGVCGAAIHILHRIRHDDESYFGRAQLLHNYRVMTGACILMRKQHWLDLGGMDEKFSVAYNDVDFGLMVYSKGYRNVYSSMTELYHLESQTRGYENDAVKIKRFSRETALLNYKWGNQIYNDPFHNENLSYSNHLLKPATQANEYSPYRTKYANLLNVNDFQLSLLPQGLNTVDKTDLPCIPIQTTDVSALLHKDHKYEIHKIFIFFHVFMKDKLPVEHKTTEWKITYKDPNTNQWKAIEAKSTNGSSVVFDLSEPLNMSNADRLEYKLNVVKTPSTIYLNWFYADGDFLFPGNKYTRVFNTGIMYKEIN